jgi:uncharacterized protein with GYD domain
MPKYLIEASYSNEGVSGVTDKGATARREEIERFITASGGKLESFYFAFGDVDAYLICELPSNEVAAALAVSVKESGYTTSFKTVVLLTPEELDAAAKIAPLYRPPGAFRSDA